MLDIDTARPFKLPSELCALVEAVRNATHVDEADWIEWKRELDLGDHDGQGTLARHVLGMANRDVDLALRSAGGYGYVLIGVEPGNCPGIPLLDPADLEPRIQQFLNRDDGLMWQPIWVDVDGLSVLVIIVDPPRQSDPIRTLEKEFDKYRPGAIFVRRKGQTDGARPEDIRRLTARAVNPGAQRLTVELATASGTALTLRPVDLTDDAIQPWLDQEEEDLLAPLLSELERRSREREVGKALTQAVRDTQQLLEKEAQILASAISGRRKKEERRTPEEYRLEVAEYLARAHPAGADVALERFVASGAARVELVLVNPADRPYRDVEVTLFLPRDGVAVFAELPEGAELPERPRAWGPRWVDPLGGLTAFDVAAAANFARFDLYGRDNTSPSVEVDAGGGTRLRFPPLDLGPQDRRELDPIHIVVLRHDGQPLAARWEARSTHAPGVASGELVITVANDPAPAHALLRWELPEE